MQYWQKIGRVFEAKAQFRWMKTHAAVPFVRHARDDVFTVYFSTRNQENRSSIGWIEIDILDSLRVLDIGPRPVLESGDVGFFDDDGVMGCQMKALDGKVFLYFIAWNKSVNVHLEMQ